MKVIALVSGGKDSCYNMMQCVALGHDIVALANLKPAEKSGKDELDSYMYQTVGHDAIHCYAECMDLPLYRREIRGQSQNREADYHVTQDDETEDLYDLLKDVKELHPGVEGVSVGAILSNYQRVRVEHVCRRLQLTVLAFLWRREQSTLLKEMVDAGVEALIIKVATIGLDERHLGKTLDVLLPHLLKMHAAYDLHICGEGGEYETLCVDCPLFRKRIVIEEAETVVHAKDAFAPVAYLRLKRLRLEDKAARLAAADWMARVNSNLATDVLVKSCVEQATSTCSPTASHPGTNSIYAPVSSPTLCIKAVDRFRCQTIGHQSFAPPYVFIAGLTAYDDSSDFGNLYSDITSETTAVMRSLEGRLSSLNIPWCDVIMVHIFVKSMKDFAAVNDAYGSVFDVNPPARATVQLSLPAPVKVQIDCVAVSKMKNSNSSIIRWEGIDRRETMHVQGLSFWAPANIGPYSQAVLAYGHVYQAGQIGLQPSVMDMASPKEPGETQLSAELCQSLVNQKSVIEAMGYRLEADTALAICYVAANSSSDRVATEKLVTRSWDNLRKALIMSGEQSESSLAAPPFVVVWVPGLPRNAKAEWELILSAPMKVVDDGDTDSVDTDHLHHAKVFETDQLYDSRGLKVRGRAWMRGTLGAGVVNACVLPTFNVEHVEDHLMHLVGKLVNGIQWTLDALKGEQTDTSAISLRVLYSIVRRASIVEALERSLQNSKIKVDQLAIVYMPVVAVGDFGVISVAVLRGCAHVPTAAA